MPWWGKDWLLSRRIKVWLGRRGYQISRKRVQRSMRTMGLQAIYRRPLRTVPGWRRCRRWCWERRRPIAAKIECTKGTSYGWSVFTEPCIDILT
ncbi:MAG TPA: transposase [Dehalococcoidia bacterium]|nr:transposase [Dehalococcoidia bacterium]